MKHDPVQHIYPAAPAIRTTFLDYDARRDPKTDWHCIRCQRDLKPGQSYRCVHVVGGGGHVLHPEDAAAHKALFPQGDPADLYIHPVGMDCARALGIEFTYPGEVIQPPAETA